MIYFIADTHWYHKRILEYEPIRPWSTIEEMNEGLIENWNQVVGEEDEVYHLGDEALNCTVEQLKGLMDRLKGRKILVKGNHSRLSTKKYLEVGFSEVYSILKLEYRGKVFLLTHKPKHSIWGGSKGIEINLHGHLHSRVVPELGKDYFCVSVERIDYRPISIEEVYRRICG